LGRFYAILSTRTPAHPGYKATRERFMCNKG
jgi:hypothetical protein